MLDGISFHKHFKSLLKCLNYLVLTNFANFGFSLEQENISLFLLVNVYASSPRVYCFYLSNKLNAILNHELPHCSSRIVRVADG